MDHYYAFELREAEPIPFYRRTFGTMRDVLHWLTKDNPRGHKRFYTVNCLPKRYWY